jgi:hypothetical protein
LNRQKLRRNLKLLVRLQLEIDAKRRVMGETLARLGLGEECLADLLKSARAFEIAYHKIGTDDPKALLAYAARVREEEIKARVRLGEKAARVAEHEEQKLSDAEARADLERQKKLAELAALYKALGITR